MNKLFMTILTLSSMFSLVAMEKEQEYRLKPITKKESDAFVSYALSAAEYSLKAVGDGRIASDNAMHCITCKYNQFLILANDNLSTMIEQQGLRDRLESFRKFEFDQEIVKVKDSLLNSQIQAVENGEGAGSLFKDGSCTFMNVEKGSTFDKLMKQLTERRKLLAALNLRLKQPTFCMTNTGSETARIDSVLANKDYPVDGEAIKDWLATMIYRQVLAQRPIIYMLQDKSAVEEV